MLNEIYNTRILKLAADIPLTERLSDADASATAVSKLCGSKVTVDVRMEGDRVVAYGQEVKACALGQAAAAVLGEHVLGASVEEIEMAKDRLSAMLRADGPPPSGRFEDLAVLQPVKDFPARHASTLLAFEAAAAAAREAHEREAARTSPAVAG